MPNGVKITVATFSLVLVSASFAIAYFRAPVLILDLANSVIAFCT